jgi:hypothetical protein
MADSNQMGISNIFELLQHKNYPRDMLVKLLDFKDLDNKILQDISLKS